VEKRCTPHGLQGNSNSLVAEWENAACQLAFSFQRSAKYMRKNSGNIYTKQKKEWKPESKRKSVKQFSSVSRFKPRAFSLFAFCVFGVLCSVFMFAKPSERYFESKNRVGVPTPGGFLCDLIIFLQLIQLT